MSEVEWSEFIESFKPVKCKVVNGKLVCEGVLGDEFAVCEIKEVDGRKTVSCRKYISESTVV